MVIITLYFDHGMVVLMLYFDHGLLNLFRFIDLQLKRWMDGSHRKPLLFRGARQVGKTFAVRKLGEIFEHYVEVNFEEAVSLRKIFDSEKDLDPVRITRDLSLALKKEIKPGKTLLFLDEVQMAPNAIIALRYFYEKMPDLHVVAAGSLLDFAIEKVGVPVGRVTFLYLYPMSWIEFLIALGHQLMVKAILSHALAEAESEVIHNKILEILRIYCAIGGMPEAVAYWVKTQDPQICAQIHQSIIQSYRQDFHKYAKLYQVKYVELIFESTLQQLGQKFKFSQLEGEYRKRELSPALDLLEKAGVLYRVFHTSGQGIPLGADLDLQDYKLIFLDIGLSQALLGLDLADWFLHGTPAFANKGTLVEAFVGQELLAYSDPSQKASLYYWHRAQASSSAEVDYLIQSQGQVLPIEVKSKKGRSLRSMHSFLDSHPKSPFGIRFSTHNYSVQEQLVSCPLYAIARAIQWQNPAAGEDSWAS